MCDQFRVITPTGEEIDCDTVLELACALGVTASDFRRDGEECLCGIEEEDIAEVMHGSVTVRRLTMKEGFPFPAYIVNPISQPEVK